MFANTIISFGVATLLRRRYKPGYYITIVPPTSVEENGLLESAYRFRYKMYCEIHNLLKAENYPDRKETDEYDKYSYHIIARGSTNQEVVGYSRIILYTRDYKLPTIKFFKHISNKLPTEDKVVEFSRLMVNPKWGKTLLLVDLMRAGYYIAKNQNKKYILGEAEEWFFEKILKRLHIEFKILGDPLFVFNAMNFPFLIDIPLSEKALKRKNLLLYMYFSIPPFDEKDL